MAEFRNSAWPWPRIVGWGLTAAVVAAMAGPAYVRSFVPPTGAYTDFLQEWLSARNYFSGAPLYREIPESLQEHMKDRRRPAGATRRIAFTDPATGVVIAEMKYNAHPPVAVLFSLPFACLDYPYAHLAWNIITYGLFLISIAVVVRELGIPFPGPALFPALILLLGNPVLNQVYQGQLNCLLAALITGAWVADRHGQHVWAGAAIGLAGALKLYPVFLLIYFLFTRRWRGLAAGISVFLAANGLAAALFGVTAFEDYARDVVPSIAGQFQASWANMSFHGFWLRFFRTEPVHAWITPTVAHKLGFGFGWGASVITMAIVALVCWRSAGRSEHDRAFALAVVAMLLVSPITWPHYSLLLLVPLGLAWMRATSALAMGSLCAVLAVIWLPSNFGVQIWLGRDGPATFNELLHPRLTPGEDLVLVSVGHYALLGLFLLLLTGTRADPAPPPEPKNAGCQFSKDKATTA